MEAFADLGQFGGPVLAFEQLGAELLLQAADGIGDRHL